MAVHMYHYYSTSFNLQTHYLSNAKVCGPPDLRAVAHRLRTSVLELRYIFFVLHSKLLAIIKNYFLINTALLSASLQIERQNFM